MKKRWMAMFLVFAMAATMIGGCGKSTDAEEPIEETVEEGTVEEVAEVDPELIEPVYEKVFYTVALSTANDDGTYIAYDSEHAYIVSLSEEMPDEDRDLFSEGAVLKLTVMKEVTEDETAEDVNANADSTDAEDMADADENTEGAANAEDPESAEDIESTDTASDEIETFAGYGDPIGIEAVAAETIEEAESYELNQVVFRNLNGFSIEEYTDTTMYAKSSVNVRSGPSTDYEVLGQLSFAQEVTMTGLTDTDWYRINYGDGTAYVAASYMVTEKPVVTTASTGGSSGASSGSSSGSSSSGSSGSSAGSSSGSNSVGDHYAAYKAALAAGDTELAKQILNGNYDGASSSSGEASSNTAGSPSSESTSATSIDGPYTSQDFLNYLNEQRAAEGLGTLEWDSSLASTAQTRAKEIVSNFSHEGATTVENCLISTTTDVSSWYTQWYNSTGHRMNMFDSTYTKAAVAYCICNGKYYVVTCFGR